MYEVMKLESDYNRERYRGGVKYIRINSRLVDELIQDPINGHKVSFREGSVEISGIGLIPTSDIEKWELIYGEKV